MEMISKELQFCITILVTAVQLTTADGVKLTTKPVIPEIQKELTISCKSPNSARTFYHNGVMKTGCNKYSCQPPSDAGNGYTYTSNYTISMVKISSLNRTRDEGLWTCSSLVNQSLMLIAYSFPRSLLFTDKGDTERDLALSSATLRCQTDGCAHPPSANISWFYKNFTSATQYLFSGQEHITTDTETGSCTKPEQIYTSTLTLPRYMTTPDNSDTTLMFTCGIEYSDPSRNLYSSDSRKIRFAVSVTKIDLQINGQTVSDNSTIAVISGEVMTIACTSGTSRPLTTMAFYIGRKMKMLSSKIAYPLIPNNEDHNKVIYCRAYSFLPGTIVESSKAILFVNRVPDVKVTISESDLSNKTVALICEARGVSTNNTFYPWVHMWQHHVIRKDLHGLNNSTHSVLYIDSHVLENMGTYICSATNGVSDSNGTNVQTGSKQINYTGLPKILSTTCMFTGEIGQSVHISIPIYSDQYVKMFQIQKHSLSVMDANNTKIYLRHEDIGYQMYNTPILLQAQVVHLEIKDLSELDFGNYILLFKDSIQTSMATFEITPNGPDTSDNEGRNLFSVLTVPAVAVIAIIAGVTIYQKRKTDRKKAFVDDEINNGIQLRSTQNANSSAATSGNGASDTSYEDVQDCRTGTSQDQHIDNNIPTALRHSGCCPSYANTSYSGETSDTGYDILQARGTTGENPHHAISNDQREYCNQPIALRLPESSNIYMNTANASTGKGVEHENLHWTLETIEIYTS